MKRFYLNIVSPEGVLFDGEAEQVTLPGVMGRFTILPHHAPIVSSLCAGILSYKVNGVEQELKLSGGFVEMNNNKVSVCVEQKEL